MTNTSSTFRQIDRRLTILIMLANAVGAGLTFFFFTAIYPIQPAEASANPVNPIQQIIFFGLTGLLLTLGGIVDTRNSQRIGEWYNHLQAGGSPDEVPEAVQKLVLNNVPRGTAITLGMWFMAATMFSGLTLFSGYDFSSFLLGFIGIFGVGGIITAAVTFFGADLTWRKVIPVFFPSGQISRVPAFRLSVLKRLLIVFLLTSVLPLGLIVLLSLQRAKMMVGADNPQLILENLFVLQLFILGVSLAVNVGMAMLVTRSITGPIHDLQTAMASVEQNRLSTQVRVTTTDELGYLGEHFNQMTAGLRQGEMLRNLLNLYVTPEVAREAMEHGVQLGGRLVDCTVLFADIRDFTGISERMQPESLIEMLNRYMSAMVEVITTHGGLVNKFGGDSLLAVFGSPLNPAEDHAARGVLAAQGMLCALEAFNQNQAAAGEPVLRIGIGLASGPVVAGNVGGRERIEYTVIGDTVNLASRLQSLTKEIGRPILVSAATQSAAIQQLRLEVQEIPGVVIRGKDEPVNVYAVL